MTKITSTDETWNTIADGTARCNEVALSEPLGWKKSRRVSVNSMCDTFCDKVPDEFIHKMFAVMVLCPQHTFQVLTKRPERMAQYFGEVLRDFDIALWVQRYDSSLIPDGPHVSINLNDLDIAWPLENVWLGTSIEDQATADERIPHLLRCPAAIRFLSVEPMLAPVVLPLFTDSGEDMPEHERRACNLPTTIIQSFGAPPESKIHWVIIGGESGSKARPFHLEWARDLILQCREAGVAVFVKQLGCNPFLDGKSYKPGKGKRTDPVEWPEDLRIQEYPPAGRYL